MRTAISFIFAFAMAALPAAAQDTPLLNPPVDGIRFRSLSRPVHRAEPVVGRMTNAKRFAMNLPPLKPKSLHRGTRSATAPRSGTSMSPRSGTSMSPPIPHGCNIQVKDVNGTSYGYISPAWNAYGEYGAVQPDQADSLGVSFNISPDDPSPDELEIHADNGSSISYPFFGAMIPSTATGYNLGPDNLNYAFITGNTQITAGSVPTTGDKNSFTAITGISGHAETAIWKYDPVTHEITAQWINTDGSRPTTYLVYFNDHNNAIILTGDVRSVQSAFGVPYPAVTLTCVPPQPVQLLRE